jgi:hypothetical protein
MKSPTTTILWRVCWNDFGWQKPSGGFKEAGYPLEHGFGHEEWNFRLDDAIDGWVYGYVYKTSLRRAGTAFRIVFFAIDPETKERIVVGIYHAAEFIVDEDRDHIAKAFARRGIFRRRASELRRATDNRYSRREALEFVRNAVSDPVLMVRCRVPDVEIPRTRIPLQRISGQQSVGHRFKSFTYLEDAAYFGDAKNRAARAPRRWVEPQQGALSEEAYRRITKALLKIIVPRHRRLSNAFCRWLKAELGATGVQERDCIDIRCEIGGRDVLTELKICHGTTTRKAIRESLGQLLEYNHYGARLSAQDWAIVLDQQPTPHDLEFIAALRTVRKLPLVIGWRTEHGFSFYPDWPGGR